MTEESSLFIDHLSINRRAIRFLPVLEKVFRRHKRALAGLRIGLSIGQPELIEALERVKNSFNFYPHNRLAIAGAIASYEDEACFQKTWSAIIENRKVLVQGMRALGFNVLPSTTNFIFACHSSHDAGCRFSECSIIVRHFDQPRICQYLRISVGNPSECAALVNALAALTQCRVLLCERPTQEGAAHIR